MAPVKVRRNGVALMAGKIRLDVSLPVVQHDALQALAAETGFRPGALARMAINHFLARRDLVLTGSAGGGSDLDAFIAEMRGGDPGLVPVADQLAAAFAALDLEADTNRNAAGLIDCLSIVARARGSIEQRLAVMLELVKFKGVVAIPREWLHPKPKRAKEILPSVRGAEELTSRFGSTMARASPNSTLSTF
jgi:hypothetical protein